MASPEGATLDRDSITGVGTADLDYVVPVADIAILDIYVSTAQVNAIGIGRGPGRSDAQSRGQNVGAVS